MFSSARNTKFPEERFWAPWGKQHKTTTLSFHCAVVQIVYIAIDRGFMEVLVFDVQQGTRSHSLGEELKRRQVAEENRLLNAKISSLANPLCSG